MAAEGFFLFAVFFVLFFAVLFFAVFFFATFFTVFFFAVFFFAAFLFLAIFPSFGFYGQQLNLNAALELSLLMHIFIIKIFIQL